MVHDCGLVVCIVVIVFVSADIEFVCCIIVINMKIMTHIGADIRTMMSKRCQSEVLYARAKCQDNEKREQIA